MIIACVVTEVPCKAAGLPWSTIAVCALEDQAVSMHRGWDSWESCSACEPDLGISISFKFQRIRSKVDARSSVNTAQNLVTIDVQVDV